MKKFRVFSVFVLLALIAVLAGCNLFGINGSNIPAGTYALEGDYGTWTLILDAGSFEFKYADETEGQTFGYKGTFGTMEDVGDDYWEAELDTLEEWVSGTTYDEVTISGQTIKLTYWEDYPLDEVETEGVSFYLDADGDGDYTYAGGDAYMLGMLLTD